MDRPTAPKPASARAWLPTEVQVAALTTTQVVPYPPSSVSCAVVTYSSPTFGSADRPRVSTDSSPGLDQYENILPIGSATSQLKQRRIWSEAASTVIGLLADSAAGGAVAWLINYVFTFGNFLSGQSAKTQSYASFNAGVMSITSLALAGTLLVAQAASMTKLHFLETPGRHASLGQCISRLARRTVVSYVVSLALTVSSAYGLALLPASVRFLKLQFYASGLFVNLYTVSLDLAHRRIFQLETVEGIDQAPTARGSYVKKVLRLMVKDILLVSTVYLAAIYVHITSQIPQRAAQLAAFSIIGYAFKLVVQEVTKRIVIQQKKSNVKTIYLAVAVPTVLIDTQIRTRILRHPNASQSMAGTVALAVLEMLFRFAKIWFIRYEVWHNERRVIKAIAESLNGDHMVQSDSRTFSTQWWQRSTLGLRVVRTAIQEDPRYIEFLQWRRRLLRFHAAEIHADMYAEYLAIVCSMSIYFFYHAHPKYAWTAAATEANSDLADLTGQAKYLAVQVAMEMAVDFLSCLWELANGVPMQHSKQMRGFISALFISCSITNIILSANLSMNNGDE